MPLLIDLPGLSFTSAYFESMSGLSTTGATVLTGLDHLPHSINLWRHALSWLGGMGIIVLAVAILPLLGRRRHAAVPRRRARARQGCRSSRRASPRPRASCGSSMPGMTVACTLALWAAGMSLFDAICHAFSTMALGGFSTHDASIGYFDSPMIEFGADDLHADRGDEFRHAFLALRKGDFEALSARSGSALDAAADPRQLRR